MNVRTLISIPLVLGLGLLGLLLFQGCANPGGSTCAKNSDCLYGQHCRSNKCSSLCSENTDCDSGQTCNKELGKCTAGNVPPVRREPAPSDGGVKDNNPTPRCGDGRIDPGEECDGTNLAGQSCQSRGFDSGNLSCSTSCTLDTTQCKGKKEPKCGDGILDAGEQCDGNNLNSTTCTSLGFASGDVKCSAQCRFDTSSCVRKEQPKCGNGKLDTGEPCDGSNLNGKTCLSLGFASGTLKCDKCRVDTSACVRKEQPRCGNGKLDAGEQCDGSNLNGKTCKTQGFTSGTLGCKQCKLDTGACTNSQPGKKKFGERCADPKDCDTGLICVVLKSGDAEGYCAATCASNRPCPSTPAGAGCILKTSSTNLCGWQCDPNSNKCPAGLNCVPFGSGHICAAAKAPTPAQCGNNKAEAGEDCDGSDLNGQTCKSQGFTGGTLKCKSGCLFDTSACSGNQTTPSGKFGKACKTSADCDSGHVCVEFSTNASYCTAYCDSTKPCPTSPPGASCRFKLQSGKTICGWATNSGGPPVCGNGVLDPGEDCDKSAQYSTCKGLGYTGGTLKCSSTCKLDTSSCTGQTTCTNIPSTHCTGGCSTIVSFSPVQGNGYIVTHGSRWSWMRRDAMLSVKYAAASVACVYKGTPPLGLGDMSEQNGGTPKDSSGRLRHPQGTHTNGSDIDLAYYQVNQPNNYLRAVCTHTTNGRDQYHCTAAPKYLDAEKTAFFLAKILESGKVRVIGVDGKIGPLLMTAIDKLYQKGLVTDRLRKLFKNGAITYEVTDTGRGWFRFHHHHAHISYR